MAAMSISTNLSGVNAPCTGTDQEVFNPVDAPTDGNKVLNSTTVNPGENNPIIRARKARADHIAVIATAPTTFVINSATTAAERQRKFVDSTILWAGRMVDTRFLGLLRMALAATKYHDVPGSSFDNMLMAAKSESAYFLSYNFTVSTMLETSAFYQE